MHGLVTLSSSNSIASYVHSRKLERPRDLKKLPTFFFARRCASAVYGMADLCLFVRLFVCLPVASRYSIKTAKRHHIYERRMIVQGLCFSEV